MGGGYFVGGGTFYFERLFGRTRVLVFSVIILNVCSVEHVFWYFSVIILNVCSVEPLF